MHISIILPIVALVFLTAIVAGVLMRTRFREMGRKKLDPQSLATSSGTNQNLQDIQASDNFKNLFEMPVLFYILCVLLAMGNVLPAYFVVGAWAYVVLRYVHSYIHLTYNRVMHRFAAYFLSTMVLFAMWAAYAIRVIRAALLTT